MNNKFKTFILTISLIFGASNAYAYGSYTGWGNNSYSYSSSPNIFGGYNFSGDGWSGSSTPNIFGGYNYTFQNNGWDW